LDTTETTEQKKKRANIQSTVDRRSFGKKGGGTVGFRVREKGTKNATAPTNEAEGGKKKQQESIIIYISSSFLRGKGKGKKT